MKGGRDGEAGPKHEPEHFQTAEFKWEPQLHPMNSNIIL